jgi:serine/threonine protein phosphatase PrpC
MTTKTLSYIAIGKRENIEDYFFISDCNTTLIVCDGVGGNHKGEEASRIASNTIGQIIANSTIYSFESDIKLALVETQKGIQEFIIQYPEANKMATTMVLAKVFPTERKIAMAHIGDSRAYIFRNNKILFKTKDHSLVNEMLKSGFITKAEAENHPQKNVITRSINATGTSNPDIAWIDLIQEDKILLCSDGVNETWSDGALNDLFSKNYTIAEELSALQNECLIHSKDNHTAIIHHIQYTYTENTTAPLSKQKKNTPPKWLLIIFGLVILVVLTMFFFTKKEIKYNESIKSKFKVVDTGSSMINIDSFKLQNYKKYK